MGYSVRPNLFRFLVGDSYEGEIEIKMAKFGMFSSPAFAHRGYAMVILIEP